MTTINECQMSCRLGAKKISSMKRVLMGLFVLALTTGVERAHAQTVEEIAKAYVQAIVDGTGSKAAGNIDFGQRNCGPSNVFGNECQGVVRDGKDGKTFLMEAITSVSSNDNWSQSNIKTLIPEADLRRVFSDLLDPKFNDTRRMLYYLSTRDNGWYSGLEGTGKAKVILQRYMESIGGGKMYGNFVWPFNKADASQAKLTEVGVKIKINKIPDQSVLRSGVDYLWSLFAFISDKAYPATFSYTTSKGKPLDFCANTTWELSLGRIGWYYNSSQKIALGSAAGDAEDGECSGGDFKSIDWKTDVWYDYKLKRGKQLGPKLWEWEGEIIDATDSIVYQTVIYGGEYVTAAVVRSDMSARCDDPASIVEWREPYVGNLAGKFRVGRIELFFGNDSCLRSMQKPVSLSPLAWRQDHGSNAQPAPHATAAELRTNHREWLTEVYRERTADPTEVAIAGAYVQAISGGSGAKAVSDAVDFTRNDCTAQTVWEANNCQAKVFNDKDGKTVLMEAISPVTRGADWRSSNIKVLIPEADMRRIMTDPRYKNARDLFGYMSDLNNNWYSWLAGDGKAKDILRRYMDASR